MRHHTQDRYPVSSEVIMRMFTDPHFHRQKLSDLGVEHEIIHHAFEAEAFRLKIGRSLLVDAGGLVSRLMPRQTRIVNDELWCPREGTGRVKVQVQGVPLRMDCSVEMIDEAQGCLIHCIWDVKARIPLGAGALERFVVSDMERRAEQELRATIALLDGYK